MSITISLTLPKAHLRAAALFASDDETRYVLQGVLVETYGPRRQSLLTATDGRRMACVRTSATHDFPDHSQEPHAFILPLSLITAIVLESNREPHVTLLYKKSPDVRVGTITVQHRHGEISHTSQEIEGNYPNYPAVFPEEAKGTQPLLICNPQYFSSFNEAAKLLDVQSFRVAMPDDPNHPFVIHIGPDFFGVIMPIRDDSDRTQPLKHPRWIMERIAESKAKSATQKA